MSIRNKPAIWHFLLIGVCLFIGEQWLALRASYRIEAPADSIMQQRYQDWFKQTGTPPTDAQKAAMLQAEIDASMLFSEALRLELYRDDAVVYQRLLRDAAFLGIEGDEKSQIATALELELHKGDEVIRRRLIQRMESIGMHSMRKHSEPDIANLKTRYETERERWRQPPRFSITQIFFSADRPEPEQRAAIVLKELQRGDIDSRRAQSMGDTFLMGHTLPLESSTTLAKTFGQNFADELLERYSPDSTGLSWIGPVTSAFGVHLIQVSDYRPSYYRSFDDVLPLLRDDYLREQEQQSLQDFLGKLREKYQVVTP